MRKQIEGELAKSETRLRRITDNMLDVINETDGDIKITYVSPSVKELLGYSPEDLIGNQFYDFIHPEDRSDVDEAILQAISNPDEKLALTQEFRLKHLQKGYIWVEAVTRFLFDAEGNIERSITVSRDITERKRIQDAETKARKMAEALQVAGIALSSSLQFDQVLKMILEQAAQVVSFDSASVLLLEDNDLVIMNTLGFPDAVKLIGNRITITGNNPNKMVIKRENLLLLMTFAENMKVLKCRILPGFIPGWESHCNTRIAYWEFWHFMVTR